MCKNGMFVAEHRVADTAGGQLLPPAQLPAQGRQAGEHPHHQGGPCNLESRI